MEITADDIEEYKLWRKDEGVADATVNREIACLKRMFNLAIKWGQANVNPVNDVDFFREPPGRTRFLSIEEINRLLECANENIRPVIFAALNTGMRLGEILTLKWSQVRLEGTIEPYVKVEGKTAKNNKDRWIPLNDAMCELLSNLQDNGSDFVFLNRFGRPYSSVRTACGTACRRAGIEDFHFHDLRHTFASHFIMSGGDLLTLKEILGHSSMDMVQRYAHLAAAHKRKQLNGLSNVLKICHLSATNQVTKIRKEVLST